MFKMDKRTKNALLTSLVMVICLVIVTSVFYAGSILSPYAAILLCEVGFSFVVIPRCVILYYKLYECRPSYVGCFIPIYNSTMVMSPLMTKLILSDVLLVLVLGVLSKFKVAVSWMEINDALRALDYIMYGTFTTALLYFILTGIGLAKVFAKVQSLYKVAFDNSEMQYGIYKVVGNVFAFSNVLTFIAFALPVVRLLPTLILMDKLSDLTSAGILMAEFEGEYEEYSEV